MMRSMFTGVSSLRTHQTKMDVIANNIANVNTVGFKSSRVTFNEVFSQTTQGASRANDATGRGGTNPMQIGLGVNVASIDKMMSTGAAQRTDRSLDLMINGDGFFIVGDESGTYFTRAGALNLDVQGNLVISNGMKVYGWDAEKRADGTYGIQKTTAAPITIGSEKKMVDPTSTELIEYAGSLNADAIKNSTDGNFVSTMSFFDSLGNRYTVDVTWTYIDNDAAAATADGPYWTYTMDRYAYINGDKKGTPLDVAQTADGLTNATYPASHSGAVRFETNGSIKALYASTDLTTTPPPASVVTLAPGATAVVDNTTVNADFTITMNLNNTDTSPKATFGDGSGNIKVDLNNLKQYGKSSSTAQFNTIDGNAFGTLETLSVGGDGIITGSYSNGDKRILGQIPIALFQNPAGLESYGSNLYIETANSGDFNGTGVESGNIMGGVLEMSNVDLGSEFTEMITTQRGFQAGSRLITTSDDMIQELVNLKR